MGSFRKPIILNWAAGKAGCELVEGFQIKLIQHEGISLCINPPRFDADETEIFFIVSSTHPKAVGLGDGGITLVADGHPQICKNLRATAPVRGLEIQQHAPLGGTRRIMIDSFQNAQFAAQFQPVPEPDRASAAIVIEMKRLWAPNFMFVVPVSESTSVASHVD